MISLQESVLMSSKLFQLLLEKLRLVIRYRLLVQNQNLGNIVVMDL